MANLIPFVLYAMPFLKERYPDRTIILGGVGTAFIEKEILKRIPEVDIIHRGEGEQTVPVLIKALREGKPLDAIPGLFYRRNGGSVLLRCCYDPADESVVDHWADAIVNENKACFLRIDLMESSHHRILSVFPSGDQGRN